MNTNKKMTATLLTAVVALFALGVQAAIVGISKPVGSHDDPSHSSSDGIWSVFTPPYPLTTNAGIGYIINSSCVLGPSDFSIHDVHYASPSTPDPARAFVTYSFDEPTIVSSLEVIQHANGVTQIEGFIGDSPDAMTSIGSVFCEQGDVTGYAVFAEGQTNVFTFTNNQPALYFRFVIHKTSYESGYALYRAFPRDASGSVIPPGPDLFVSIQLADVDVCWPSKTNKMYQAEYRSSLTGGAWLPLGSPVQGNGTTKCITDDVRGQPQKFYRVTPVP